MNQQTITKLKLFLSGIQSRYQENEMIFTSLTFTFKSGLKNYKGRAVAEGTKLSWQFKGVREDLAMGDALERILTEAASYDSLLLAYDERAYQIQIQADDKDIRVTNQEKPEKETKDAKTSSLLSRNYLINYQKAKPLLTELGIMTRDGKLRNDKIRKYNQIDHFVEILTGDLEKFRGVNRTVHVVDCACGKSYLSFVLNYYMTEVLKIRTHFTGIDYNPGVIESSREMADNLGYRNMEFIQGDIRTLTTRQKPDMVMSLHACDTATDLALNFGIRNQADLITAVPCCHAEMNTKYSYEPFEAIVKHNILKRRLADTLTDGLRCVILESQGYDTTIMEYISPLETPKNLMIKSYRTGKANEMAEAQLLDLILKLDYAPALYRYLNDLDDPAEKPLCANEEEPNIFSR